MPSSAQTVIDEYNLNNSRQYLTPIKTGMLNITYPREQSYDLVGLVQDEVVRLEVSLGFMKVNPRGESYDMYIHVEGDLDVVEQLFDLVLSVDNVVLMES